MRRGTFLGRGGEGAAAVRKKSGVRAISRVHKVRVADWVMSLRELQTAGQVRPT